MGLFYLEFNMNKKINDIASEAKNDTALYGGKPGDKDFDERFQQKFAELIIKESANLVEDFEITQEVADGEYVDYEASAVLKEYWGIE